MTTHATGKNEKKKRKRLKGEWEQTVSADRDTDRD